MPSTTCCRAVSSRSARRRSRPISAAARGHGPGRARRCSPSTTRRSPTSTPPRSATTRWRSVRSPPDSANARSTPTCRSPPGRLRSRSSPPVIYVPRPGEQVTITATIEHAYDTRLGWYADRGEWANGGGDRNTRRRHAHLHHPGERRRVPDGGIRIEVESSVAPACAPDGDRPATTSSTSSSPRSRSARIPDALTGQQVGFQATDANGQPIEVQWTPPAARSPADQRPPASTPPGPSQAYTVTAWLPGHPTTGDRHGHHRPATASSARGRSTSAFMALMSRSPKAAA